MRICLVSTLLVVAGGIVHGQEVVPAPPVFRSVLEIVSIEPEEFFPTDLNGKLTRDITVRYRIDPFEPGDLRLELTDEVSGRALWTSPAVRAQPTGVIRCPKGLPLDRMPFQPYFTARRSSGEETNALYGSLEDRVMVHAIVPSAVQAGSVAVPRLRIEGEYFTDKMKVAVARYDPKRKRFRHMAHVPVLFISAETLEIDAQNGWWESPGELWLAVMNRLIISSLPDQPVGAESVRFLPSNGRNSGRVQITRREPAVVAAWTRPAPPPFRLDDMKPRDVPRLQRRETEDLHFFGAGFDRDTVVVAHVPWKTTVTTVEDTPLATEWISETELRATLVPQVYGFSNIRVQLKLKPARR